MAVHDFTFPTGFHKFHRKSLYNFQFNRWHSLGFARYEDNHCQIGNIGLAMETVIEWLDEQVR